MLCRVHNGNLYHNAMWLIRVISLARVIFSFYESFYGTKCSNTKTICVNLKKINDNIFKSAGIKTIIVKKNGEANFCNIRKNPVYLEIFASFLFLQYLTPLSCGEFKTEWIFLLWYINKTQPCLSESKKKVCWCERAKNTRSENNPVDKCSTTFNII